MHLSVCRVILKHPWRIPRKLTLLVQQLAELPDKMCIQCMRYTQWIYAYHTKDIVQPLHNAPQNVLLQAVAQLLEDVRSRPYTVFLQVLCSHAVGVCVFYVPSQPYYVLGVIQSTCLSRLPCPHRVIRVIDCFQGVP